MIAPLVLYLSLIARHHEALRGSQEPATEKKEVNKTREEEIFQYSPELLLEEVTETEDYKDSPTTEYSASSSSLALKGSSEEENSATFARESWKKCDWKKKLFWKYEKFFLTKKNDFFPISHKLDSNSQQSDRLLPNQFLK